MFECPNCGHIQDSDTAAFYPPILNKGRELPNMKCNECNHIAVYPFPHRSIKNKEERFETVTIYREDNK
jgi:transcription elongation factor Elf1